MSALPASLRDGVTVIKWKADFTYDALKQGTSRLVCYDRSGFPGKQAFSVECTNVGNLARAAQNPKFEAMGDKKQAMLDAAEKDGTRVKPEYGSVWYHLMGADREHARMHLTIAIPGATTQSTGLRDSGKQGGVWIMNAGTTTAHIMTPDARGKIGVASGEKKTPLGFRDGASEFPGSFEPLSDHRFGVGKSFLPCRAIGCATGQLRHFGDKRLIFVTPIENDLVLCHSAS